MYGDCMNFLDIFIRNSFSILITFSQILMIFMYISKIKSTEEKYSDFINEKMMYQILFLVTTIIGFLSNIGINIAFGDFERFLSLTILFSILPFLTGIFSILIIEFYYKSKKNNIDFEIYNSNYNKFYSKMIETNNNFIYNYIHNLENLNDKFETFNSNLSNSIDKYDGLFNKITEYENKYTLNIDYLNSYYNSISENNEQINNRLNFQKNILKELEEKYIKISNIQEEIIQNENFEVLFGTLKDNVINSNELLSTTKKTL